MKIEHEVNDEALGGGIIEFEDEKNEKRKKNVKVQLKLDNSTANIIGEVIDTVNGVSYIVDGLLVPDDVRSTMKEAYNLWKFEKEGKRKSPESIAPDYIKETNLHHWFYGRAGGDTPEYREHTVEDEGQKKTKTGDERKRSNGIVGKNTKTNGHVRTKRKLWD